MERLLASWIGRRNKQTDEDDFKYATSMARKC